MVKLSKQSSVTLRNTELWELKGAHSLWKMEKRKKPNTTSNWIHSDI